MAADPVEINAINEIKQLAKDEPFPAKSERAPTLPEVMQVNSLATTVIAVVAVGIALYYAQLVFVVLLVSILLAFVLEPLVRFQQRIRIPRGVASFVSVLIFVFAIYILGNVSYNRAVEFSQELPRYRGEIQQVLGKYRRQAETLRQNTRAVLPTDNDGKQPMQVQQQSSIITTLTENLGTATEIVFAASFVPFLAFFMLSWQEHARASTVLLFRRELRSTAYALLGAITEMIRAFIVGNFLVGLFIGVLSTAIFGFLGLPYFYFVGFISGFLSLIPYLGVPLAMAPPLLAGLGVIHGSVFLLIALSVLGLHLFALNVLYPKFLGSRLQLNPLAVTLALLFWGWIWGAMGLVLAIPITAAAKIVFDHIEGLQAVGAWLGE
jgi:predicted PurR-regulated permease PerM